MQQAPRHKPENRALVIKQTDSKTREEAATTQTAKDWTYPHLLQVLLRVEASGRVLDEMGLRLPVAAIQNMIVICISFAREFQIEAN